MKVSYKNLQKYCDGKLPVAEKVRELLTMHAFEVESLEDSGADQIFDIKILPNRAADCKTEEGIAREIATLLGLNLGGDAWGHVDESREIHLAFDDATKILGFSVAQTKVVEVLRAIGCEVKESSAGFVVNPPKIRPDLGIKEDLVEEVGRILGYQNVPAVEPKITGAQKIEHDKHSLYLDSIRAFLVSKGFSEVSTSSFANHGRQELENPLASDKKYMRENLADNLRDKLPVNIHNMPLLGLSERVCFFEIGKVFLGGGEEKDDESLHIAVAVASDQPKAAPQKQHTLNLDFIESVSSQLQEKFHIQLIKSTEPLIAEFSVPGPEEVPEHESIEWAILEENTKYQKISPFPFVLRDVAVFVPQEVAAEDVEKIIIPNAAGFLVRISLFDTFIKKDEGKISYAFSLVFQSQEKTLSDDEINSIMKSVTDALNAQKGWQVR